MPSRARILFGLALGFLVPLLWLGFRGALFDEQTVTTASFQGRAVWFDGTASALLGWLVGSIFANGFTLQALGDLFGRPQKALQPAVASLVGSRLWSGAALAVLLIEICGIVQAMPRRLPDLPPGWAWYHPRQGPIAAEANAQRGTLGRIGAYPESTASEPLARLVPLASVAWPALLSPLEAKFLEVSVSNEQSAGCDSLGEGPVPVSRLLGDSCLAGFRSRLAVAIAAGGPWASSQGDLDLNLAPGSPPVLTLKKAGVVSDGKLRALLASWQRQRLLSQDEEREALKEARSALGKEVLTEDLIDRAAVDLLPNGAAWKLPAAVKAARLSSLLRLVYACENCSRGTHFSLLDRLTDPVRVKLVKADRGGQLDLIDAQLAHAWARKAAWWAEEQRDFKALDLALASLSGCGAEVHQTLLENLGYSAAEYLARETSDTLRERVARYSRRSEKFCHALVARAVEANAALAPLLESPRSC